MQRTTARRASGHRTRLHTFALAIVFGLLAVVATGPRAQRGYAPSASTVQTFPQTP